RRPSLETAPAENRPGPPAQPPAAPRRAPVAKWWHTRAGQNPAPDPKNCGTTKPPDNVPHAASTRAHTPSPPRGRRPSPETGSAAPNEVPRTPRAMPAHPQTTHPGPWPAMPERRPPGAGGQIPPFLPTGYWATEIPVRGPESRKTGGRTKCAGEDAS